MGIRPHSQPVPYDLPRRDDVDWPLHSDFLDPLVGNAGNGGEAWPEGAPCPHLRSLISNFSIRVFTVLR